ncbi:response regulator [Paralimibaculum aggregatum]|nr:response regulator [Limibaculum sp. NKW23]
MNLDGLHILLAEDNPTNQMVAAQMLSALGASISLAVDGVEAVELAAKERFDLALIDIEMPRMSGLEVMRRLRAAPPPLCDMPLIALTAYVMREHQIAVEEAGADGLIAKPILSIEQLGSEIRRFMRARQRRIEGGPRLAPDPETPPPAAAEADRAASGDMDEAQAEAAAEVDPSTYTALARSIGPDHMRDLLRQIDEDILGVRRDIETARAKRDTKLLREATHILVAVAGTLGATALQKNAQCLNSAAHSSEFNEINRLAGIVLSQIDHLRVFVSIKYKGM